jgi:fluoride exporter
MERLIWVSFGGAVGTAARYVLGGLALRLLGEDFPWGTFSVNILGSFFLALIIYVSASNEAWSATTRLALTTGVMGGFTTYSTFSYEAMEYIKQGAWTMGLLYTGATVVVCLGATFLGLAAGRAIVMA